VKHFTDKEVEKHYKRHETYVGAKTTETSIKSFLTLAIKVVGMFVRVKDADALQNELKNDYIITKEPCVEMWAVARSGQRGADNNKTHRF